MVTADVLHQKALKLSGDLRTTESSLLNLLMEMRKANHFPALGYSGVFNYCTSALKLSHAQSYHFKKVVETSERVPELKAAVSKGVLTISQARRIAPVINRKNHNEWIEKANALPQRELERAVTVVNPAAHFPKEKVKPITPELTELRVSLSPEAEEDLRRLQDVLSKKMRKHVGLGEAVTFALRQTLEKTDPIKRACRLSSRKMKGIRLKPGRNQIPAKVRHIVNLRDGGRCTYQTPEGRRCEERRWTELHHRIPIYKGGGNEATNIATVCSAHHRFIHAII